MTDYNINPCKVCTDKLRENNGSCNINEVTNCCYTTLAGILGTDNIMDVVSSPEGKLCKQCTSNMLANNGITQCDWKKTRPPVLFHTDKHYYPELLYEYKSPIVAKLKCYEMCGDNLDCISNCNLDSEAIKIAEPYSNNAKVTYDGESTKNKVIFYVFFIITAILLAYVLANFTSILTSRNIGL